MLKSGALWINSSNWR